jgi:hypothetical protein
MKAWFLKAVTRNPTADICTRMTAIPIRMDFRAVRFSWRKD